MTEREILAYLERDRVRRIDMIEAIRRGGAKILYAEADAVLPFPFLPQELYAAAEQILKKAGDPA